MLYLEYQSELMSHIATGFSTILLYYICCADIVDTVLEEDDIDDDGYLTYLEYVLARKREEARQEREKREEQRQGKKP